MLGVDDVSILVFGLIFWVREATPQQINRGVYDYCEDKLNCRYPWLAEVRYSKDERHRRYRFHQSRHGILITNKAVLTRGQDLDGYPVPGKDLLPLAKDFKECHEFGDKACLYVNLRRPEREGYTEGPYCGQNIVVEKVITHPKFGRSADRPRMFDFKGSRYDDYSTYTQHLINIKNPFAIAVLVKTVASPGPFVPTAILPRTPLDFLYVLRRVDTIGPRSKLCEYPTYERLEHLGWYSRYSRPRETVVKLRDKQHNDYPKVLCPPEMGFRSRGYEGWKAHPNERWRDVVLQGICNKTLNEGVLPYSFLIWKGTIGTFDERVKQQDGSFKSRKKGSDERLGAPIVCDGVLIGITSTWQNRGRGFWDVYVGTTLMRAYRWLIGMMIQYSEKKYNRVEGDSPYFGEHYSFRKREYYHRDYEKSMFELSLREEIQPYGGSQTTKISLFGTLVSSIVLRGLV